jgi:hypothetical protein
MVKDIQEVGITAKRTATENCTLRTGVIIKVFLLITSYMEKGSIPGIAKKYIKESGSIIK